MLETKNKNKTILITGSSSGIGRMVVKYFLERSWNVIATMRNPENEKEFINLKNILVKKLDVQDNNSISSCIKDGINYFGKIDIILNNAGYGVRGIFESSDEDQIKKQFDINVFGTMRVIKEILPHFRKNQNGIIINICSMGGIIGLPLLSLYCSSKFAIEGFTESLYYELHPFNIKVKIIEPGVISSNFHKNSLNLINNKINDYDEFENIITKGYNSMYDNPPNSIEQVVNIIYKAATDDNDQLRYIAGLDAQNIIDSKNNLDENEYRKFLIHQFL